jgi:hypothetical protein
MMQKTYIVIPDDVRFEDLNLTRDPVTSMVAFDMDPLERISEANDLDISALTGDDEDIVGGFLNAWYHAHRESGGAPDTVQEQLLAEVAAEEEFGFANVQTGPSTLQ